MRQVERRLRIFFLIGSISGQPVILHNFCRIFVVRPYVGLYWRKFVDRASKEKIVSSLNKAFDESNFLIVTQNEGLTVEEMSSLRNILREEAGTSFRVAKNSLAKIAVDNTSAKSLEAMFNGPTAIAFSNELTSSPKIIVDFAKDNEKLSIVGGMMDGELIDSEVIKKLANLPTMDELRAKIIGVLSAPATKIAGILTRPGGQLAQVIQAKSQLPESENTTNVTTAEETASEETAPAEETASEETAPAEEAASEETATAEEAASEETAPAEEAASEETAPAEEAASEETAPEKETD